MSQQSGTIKIGLGDTEITPSENLQLRGFARSQVATGTHDDLHARSIVVEDVGGKAVCIASLSIVYIDRQLVERIRREIGEKTGIPEEAILLSCTHTHAGPFVEEAPESYREFLFNQAVKSAVDAWESRFPGRIGIDSTQVMELGRNRRRLLYGGIHPDPQVALIKIEDLEGQLRGVLFNYGCHPSSLDWQNRLYSEDWPYYAIEGLREKFGEDVWICYLQSAQGDINTGYASELSAVGVDMPVRTYWYIEIKGKQMTDAVSAALPGVDTVDSLSVDAATARYDFPLRKSFSVSLEAAEKEAAAVDEKLAEMEANPEYAGTRTLDYVRSEHFSAHQRHSFAKRFYSEDFPDIENIELQAIRIGDGVFFSLPGEVFSEIALAVKKQSSYAKTYAAGVANGFYGYMPRAADFIEGDYEVDGCKYSPDAERVMIESALDVIGRLGG